MSRKNLLSRLQAIENAAPNTTSENCVVSMPAQKDEAGNFFVDEIWAIVVGGTCWLEDRTRAANERDIARYNDWHEKEAKRLANKPKETVEHKEIVEPVPSVPKITEPERDEPVYRVNYRW